MKRSFQIGRGLAMFGRRLIPFVLLMVLVQLPKIGVGSLRPHIDRVAWEYVSLLFYLPPVLILVAGAAISATVFHAASGEPISLYRALGQTLRSGSVWGASVLITAAVTGVSWASNSVRAWMWEHMNDLPMFVVWVVTVLPVLAAYTLFALAPSVAAVHRPGVLASLRRGISLPGAYHFANAILIVLLAIGLAGATNLIYSLLGENWWLAGSGWGHWINWILVGLHAVSMALYASINGSLHRGFERRLEVQKLAAVFE